jgi:hypothetical protein
VTFAVSALASLPTVIASPTSKGSTLATLSVVSPGAAGAASVVLLTRPLARPWQVQVQ